MHSLVDNPFQCLWFEQSREPLLAVLPEGTEEGLLLLSRRRGQVGTAAAACRHWCCCCGPQRRKSITRRWKVCRRGENDLSLVSQGKMSWRCFSRWISGSHLSLSFSLSLFLLPRFSFVMSIQSSRMREWKAFLIVSPRYKKRDSSRSYIRVYCT